MSFNVHDYSDILDKPHHVSLNRPQMTIENRAAQFAPFAALTGYGEAINETGRYVEEKHELNDEEFALLNECISSIKEGESKVTAVYFVPDKKKQGGSYRKKSAIVRRVDEVNRFIEFTDREKIAFGDLLSLTNE